MSDKIEKVQEGQETPILNCELLPITDRDDKFSQISNLAIFNYSKDLDEQLGLKTSSDAIYLKAGFFYDKLTENGIDIKTTYDNKSYFFRLSETSGVPIPFFKTKDITILWENILIETTDGEYYTWSFEKYLLEWLKSLKVEKNKDAVINKAKKTQKFVCDNWVLTVNSPIQALQASADDFCVIEQNKNWWHLCILKDNQLSIYKYLDKELIRESQIYDISAYGDIKWIETDKNNNFYFIIAESDWKSYLKVLNRNSLEEILSFEWIKEFVYLSDVNNKLFCKDEEGYLRTIALNTGQFGLWYVDSNPINFKINKANVIKVWDIAAEKLKESLESWGIKLTVDPSDESTGDDPSSNKTELIEKIREIKVDSEEGELTLKDLFDNHTKNLEDVNKMISLINKLKENPQVMAVPWVMDPIVSAISKRKEQLWFEENTNQLNIIKSDLETNLGFKDMIRFKEELKKIKIGRTQMMSLNQTFDDLFASVAKTIDDQISSYKENNRKQLQEEIKDSLKQITSYMENILYMSNITSVYNTDLWNNMLAMLDALPDELKKQTYEDMQQIIENRQKHLNKDIENEKKLSKQQEKDKILELKKQIKQVKQVIATIDTEEQLKQIQDTDPLVKNIEKGIQELWSTLNQDLEASLHNIFVERILEVRCLKEDGKLWFGKLDQYGIPKSLYFVPDTHKNVRWNISGKELWNWKVKLQFISSVGNIIEPNINKKIIWNYDFTYTQEEWIKLRKLVNAWNKEKNEYYNLLKMKNKDEKQKERFTKLDEDYYIPRMLDIMNKITWEGKLRDINHRTNIPHIDNRAVITPSIQEKLGERWRFLNLQLLYKQWYMIVESDPGTWKNFKCDLLWYLTNREVFDVSCNESMEKEDLLFSPEIDSSGTFTKPSKLVRALQTPWAIIVLDEVNTLRAWTAKLLNPLLDGRRYINDPQIWKIKAHPSVVIIGLTNPRWYLGTKPIPQEQISRAIMVNDDYMPTKEEAFMFSKYLDWDLSKLSFDDFSLYWNKYIDQWDTSNNKEVSDLFIALKNVTNVWNRFREIYSQTKRWDADIWKELDYIFTGRDWMQIIWDYNWTKDIKQSILNIILPKISDSEQKDYANKVIDETIEIV